MVFHLKIFSYPRGILRVHEVLLPPGAPTSAFATRGSNPALASPGTD
ncbi:hypothetical protein HMPREF0578_1764 [Mobiluncus mulieris 28-1]|nr:hypothetical protein HMPREF0577_2264 [Mobiluncus mulieris ATCC 35243]EEZ90578.1 hypothetical protein HMPREF0578_1764 [Mobiluncus mulieris 28-1]